MQSLPEHECDKELVAHSSRETDFLRILFWNAHKHDLSNEVSTLAKDFAVDVLILIEYSGNPEAALALLRQNVDPAFEIPGHTNEKFIIISRNTFPDFKEVFYSRRFTIRKFLHEGSTALLAVLHGLDPINYDINTRSSFACEMLRDLRQVMKVHQTNKVVIVGDFNLNPYDAVMNQAAGFNAMMTKICVTKGVRKVAGQVYDYFYNPMWSHLGDLSPGVAGSIYYRGLQGQYGWNMFDQALVHHSLARYLIGVQIIHEHVSIPLANSRGHPNPKISDHFPLLVTLNKSLR